MSVEMMIFLYFVILLTEINNEESAELIKCSQEKHFLFDFIFFNYLVHMIVEIPYCFHSRCDIIEKTVREENGPRGGSFYLDCMDSWQ